MRKKFTAAIVALATFGVVFDAYAQLYSGNDRGGARDRYDRVAKGANVEEWHRRLSDPDPTVRLEAVESLGEDGTEASVEPLLEAMADADERVRLRACDYLGTIGSPMASPQLVQHLFLADVNHMAKERILVALGRIADPSTAKPVVNFMKNTDDEKLKTVAIYTLGEIAEPSTKPEIVAARDSTDNGGIKRVATDAIAKIDNKVKAAPNTQPTLIQLEKLLRPPEGR